MIVRAAPLLAALGLAACGPPGETGPNAEVRAEQPEGAEDRTAGRAERLAIERILAADLAAGADSGGPGVKDPVVTAAEMRRINVEGAPADFRRAFLAHVADWEELAQAERQLRGVAADSPDAGRLQSERIRIAAEVTKSFRDAVRIARRHGAQIPPEALRQGHSPRPTR